VKFRHHRWGDHDRYFGPLTFACDRRRRHVALELSSGDDSYDDPGCRLRASAFGVTIICALPPLVWPERRFVDTSRWNGPGSGYVDEVRRDYGFSLEEGFLNVSFGRVTHDSSTEQRWGYFLPWTRWRHVSHLVYGADRQVFAEMEGRLWDDWHRIRDAVPKVRFFVCDHDGEVIETETFVERREWRLGTGWFAWLGYVWPKKVKTSLNISFKSEVGRDKGSWKGGMIGTCIDMQPGEDHEAAFRRFCAQAQRSRCGPYRIAFVDLAAEKGGAA